MSVEMGESLAQIPAARVQRVNTDFVTNEHRAWEQNVSVTKFKKKKIIFNTSDNAYQPNTKFRQSLVLCRVKKKIKKEEESQSLVISTWCKLISLVNYWTTFRRGIEYSDWYHPQEKEGPGDDTKLHLTARF